MNWLTNPIEPMLAELVDRVPEGNYLYEVKWDGIRAILTYNKNDTRIRTRNKNDVTDKFPELQSPDFDVRNAVFDGEIISPDKDGLPSFSSIIKRVRTSNPMKIQRLVKSHPVQFYIFDCLYLNNEPLIDQPLWYRREQLAKVVNPDNQYRISEMFEDGRMLFQAAKDQRLEGILAKKEDSRYSPGKRRRQWQKVKVRYTAECKVVGYTKGSGDRAPYFGALEVAEITENGLKYRGRVGTGFSDQQMKDIHDLIIRIEKMNRPPEDASESKETTWIQPVLTAVISYNEVNPGGTFRAPVFEQFKDS